jgi:putative tricarboxylic transport membrane protein
VQGIGPQVFPYIVAAGTAVIAALTVVMALRGGFPERERVHWAGLAWVFAAILAQIVLLYAGFGFILASAALFGLAARGFGQRPLWGALAVGAVVSAVLYLLFRYGLGLALPAGPVERALASLIA